MLDDGSNDTFNDKDKLSTNQALMDPNSTQMTDDMTGDAGRATGYESGDGKDMDITLDKNVPEIADAFQGCKVGDTYTVKSDDDSELVLTKQPAPEEEPAPEMGDAAATPGGGAEPTSDNPAIAALIVKKNKS